MGTSRITVRLLKAADSSILEHIADDVFDNRVNPALVQEFLDDPRHHIAVAIDQDNFVVGMASAVHYVHPDKQAQFFINEVAVTPRRQRQGLGSKLLTELLALGRRLGCSEAWVATEPGNVAARTLYEKSGGVEDPAPFIMYTFPFQERQ